MSYIDSFEGKTLFLDTVSFIYYVEKHPKFLSILRDFFLRLDQGRFIAFTSTVTLAEVLVLPQRRKRMDLVEEYRSLLNETKNLFLVPIDASVAEETSLVRAKYKYSLPDSLQLGAARMVGADRFLTNDHALRHVSEPHIVLLDSMIQPESILSD